MKLGGIGRKEAGEAAVLPGLCIRMMVADLQNSSKRERCGMTRTNWRCGKDVAGL